MEKKNQLGLVNIIQKKGKQCVTVGITQVSKNSSLCVPSLHMKSLCILLTN